MNQSGSLWRSEDRKRHFLLPDGFAPVQGPLQLRSLMDETLAVAPESVACFEMTEAQVQRWARGTLGDTLTELKRGLDDTFAEWRRKLDIAERTPSGQPTGATQATAPALLDLLRALPGVVGQSLSRDPSRVAVARQTMTTLQHRLRESGIDVDDRVGNFADRIASIREEAESAGNKPAS